MDKEKITNEMTKTLFERARDCWGGVLESRMVARMETEHRPLTDDETIKELKYLKATIPYSGCGNERKIIRAINYLLKEEVK